VQDVFVGRDVELAALRAALNDVPQTLVIAGEAGIGKSALVERFLSELQGVTALRSGGDESEAHVRFAIADQLLRARHSGAIGAAQHVAVGMDLLELMTSSVGDHGCVVVVDDAHLVDGDSLRALLFAARRLARAPVLIVLVTRDPDSLAEGWRKLATTVVLGPLTREHVSALGDRLGVAMTPLAARRLHEHTGGNPLHARAVLRELPHSGNWLHEPRALPAPRSYTQLIQRRLARCDADVVRLLEAAATLGVRARLGTLLALAERPLAALDGALATGMLRYADAALVEFVHPLTRAAIYDALPPSRRSALNAAAAELADDPVAAMRHRVEAATGPEDALVPDVEALAQAEMARGAWPSAVATFLAAGRLSSRDAERERLALEAIEALMYSGDGAAARHLAQRVKLSAGPRRDSVMAYLAIFAGDLETAQRLLERAWERRAVEGDDRLSATIAQRRAFLATCRLRGAEAIEWAQRAVALAPDDVATALFAAASLAHGLSHAGRRADAHAALDRWLDDPDAPPPGSGFVLLALKANLLVADGELSAARAAFESATRASLEEGLLVVAALSLSGLARLGYLQGEWDDAVVAAERAIALAVESDDRWVVAQAHWAASHVPCARGDWAVAEAHVRAARENLAGFERHVAVAAIAAAALAAAKGDATAVLTALAPLHGMDAEGVDDPAYLPWHHLEAAALIETGQLDAAERFLARAEPAVAAYSSALASARLACVRGRLQATAFEEALALVEPLGMPYEQALVELEHGRFLRRRGNRRAAAELLLAARARLLDVGAGPALERCEHELAACGLTPAARKTRDYSALTPQEVAVARLVVSGMTNREISTELMVSTKTVEYHLSNVYTKIGVRSRSELRARARAKELAL
jgi:DNA-binding CsgD family transcriptional regulator/tetratricopeptide (TPR) repeat protein